MVNSLNFIKIDGSKKETIIDHTKAHFAKFDFSDIENVYSVKYSFIKNSYKGGSTVIKVLDEDEDLLHEIIFSGYLKELNYSLDGKKYVKKLPDFKEINGAEYLISQCSPKSCELVNGKKTLFILPKDSQETILDHEMSINKFVFDFTNATFNVEPCVTRKYTGKETLVTVTYSTLEHVLHTIKMGGKHNFTPKNFLTDTNYGGDEIFTDPCKNDGPCVIIGKSADSHDNTGASVEL